MNKNGRIKYLHILIILLIITDITILLDVPFLRQIFGFLFLTILPGLLILWILKLNKIGFTEEFVLSIGLSISFLMFYGLLVNNLSLSFGYARPLATLPLLIALNIAYVVLLAIGYKVEKEASFSLPNLNLSTYEEAFLIVPILFPALSIFGMHILNTTDNNIILMLLLFLIPAYVVLVCFFNPRFPKRLYPIVIFLISISILLLYSLRSSHIIGTDTHTVYSSFFLTTLRNAHWSISGESLLDACLAISVLPTIYQTILNTNTEFLFKILYSLIFSISPLIIYVITKKYLRESYAFLASCFFMFQPLFLRTACNARTTIAILFIALAVMILFNERIGGVKKRLLFIVFIASCLVSHYSSTYLFFFILLGACIGIEILSRRYTFKKVINFTTVSLFFAMIFFWYSQIIETPFNASTKYIHFVLTQLNKFFIMEARETDIQTLIGHPMVELNIPNEIEYVLSWLIIAFIGIGVITLIIKCREMSFSELKFKKPDFINEKFEVGYFMIAVACVGLLVAVVVIPYATDQYSAGRIFPVTSVILSPFFVIGGIVLSKTLSFIKKALPKKLFFRKKSVTKRSTHLRNNAGNSSQVQAYLIILLVLIPYFFCVTAVMDQMFGYQHQMILNSEGYMYWKYYIHDQDTWGMKWLSNMREQNLTIYACQDASFSSISQCGGLPIGGFIHDHKKIDEGYILLLYHNVVYGKLLHGFKQISKVHNMIEYSDIFHGKSKVYDTGGSEIYR